MYKSVLVFKLKGMSDKVKITFNNADERQKFVDTLWYKYNANEIEMDFYELSYSNN